MQLGAGLNHAGGYHGSMISRASFVVWFQYFVAHGLWHHSLPGRAINSPKKLTIKYPRLAWTLQTSLYVQRTLRSHSLIMSFSNKMSHLRFSSLSSPIHP